jgi:hypothetical protein
MEPHRPSPPPTRHQFHRVAAQNVFAAQNSLRHRRCWVRYAARSELRTVIGSSYLLHNQFGSWIDFLPCIVMVARQYFTLVLIAMHHWLSCGFFT